MKISEAQAGLQVPVSQLSREQKFEHVSQMTQYAMHQQLAPTGGNVKTTVEASDPLYICLQHCMQMMHALTQEGR